MSFGIDEVRHAEAFAPGLLVRIDVDADDHVGAGEAKALDDVKPDAAEAEDDSLGAGLDLCGIDDCADAGGDAAADVADLVERRVFANLRHRDFRQHGEIGEGRAAHVVVNFFAVGREARGAVGHHALALSAADRRTEVGLARQAGRTLPAFRCVERDYVIALFDRRDARADVNDDAGALMAQDRGKQPFGVGARQGELVGVADAGRLQFNQHFARTRAVELNGGDFEGLAGRIGHRGAHVHGHCKCP